jgi:hypothetical protein
MMNPKSKLSVKYAENTIEMNTTFAKMMQNPLSDEYALLQRTRQDFPTFSVRKRQIKSNPKKDTYNGLTYEWMRHHIETREPEVTREVMLHEFDEMIYISECHSQRLRYPTIKKWFLAKYPDVAKFGTIEVEAENQVEETNNQNVIPMPAAAPVAEMGLTG